MKKLLVVLTAAACMLAMVSCDESTEPDKPTSSQSDTSSAAVTDDSSEDETVTTSETTTTTSETTTTTSETTTTASETPSETETTTTKTSNQTSAATKSGGSALPELNEAFSKLADRYNAKEITVEGADPDKLEKAFENQYDIVGKKSLCAYVQTAHMFEPFDELFEDTRALSAVCPGAQVFMLANIVEVKDYDDGGTDVDNDGVLAAVAFTCENEAKAKEAFKAVFTEEMRSDVSEMKERGIIFEENDDYAIVATSERNLYMCYYRKGRYVYVFGAENDPPDSDEVVGTYKVAYDYVKELENVTAALGLKKPSTVK